MQIKHWRLQLSQLNGGDANSPDVAQLVVAPVLLYRCYLRSHPKQNPDGILVKLGEKYQFCMKLMKHHKISYSDFVKSQTLETVQCLILGNCKWGTNQLSQQWFHQTGFNKRSYTLTNKVFQWRTFFLQWWQLFWQQLQSQLQQRLGELLRSCHEAHKQQWISNSKQHRFGDLGASYPTSHLHCLLGVCSHPVDKAPPPKKKCLRLDRSGLWQTSAARSNNPRSVYVWSNF